MRLDDRERAARVARLRGLRLSEDDRSMVLAMLGLGVVLLSVALLGLTRGSSPGWAPSPSCRALAVRTGALGAIDCDQTPPGAVALGGRASLLMGIRLDLNRASEEELRGLPGIGPALARRIVTDRKELGAFESVESLERVRGVGPKTVARLRPWVDAH